MIIETFEKEALAFKCPYFLLLFVMKSKATSFLFSLFNILNRKGLGFIMSKGLLEEGNLTSWLDFHIREGEGLVMLSNLA